jgi:hypothetical protein
MKQFSKKYDIDSSTSKRNQFSKMRPPLWLECTECLLKALCSINLELDDAKDGFILVLEELNRQGRLFSRSLYQEVS